MHPASKNYEYYNTQTADAPPFTPDIATSNRKGQVAPSKGFGIERKPIVHINDWLVTCARMFEEKRSFRKDVNCRRSGPIRVVHEVSEHALDCSFVRGIDHQDFVRNVWPMWAMGVQHE